MPSNAFTNHLEQLLLDAEELDDAHTELRTGNPGRQYGLASLNRAIVVMSVSAWESYVEELMRESVLALRPLGPPFAAPWPALNVYVTGRLGNFNTPNQYNVEQLIRNCLGLINVHLMWAWQNCTSAQAVQRLADVMTTATKSPTASTHGLSSTTTTQANCLVSSGVSRLHGHCCSQPLGRYSRAFKSLARLSDRRPVERSIAPRATDSN